MTDIIASITAVAMGIVLGQLIAHHRPRRKHPLTTAAERWLKS